MRKPEYLSPSSISLWVQNRSDFYLRYLAENRPPREPQTQPMSIGSAFDAYVKSYLYEKLFGKRDERYVFENLFEAQVEAHNRDWAYNHGRYVFQQYKESGALADLMLILGSSPSDPRFEFEVKGVQHGYREGIEGKFGEVVLLGKPDVDFFTKEGVHCVLDWKVNGYCSKYPKSPSPYYLRLRSAGRTNQGMHGKCHPLVHNGLEINIACGLEHIDRDWARQLAIYGWLCGEPVKGDFITIIHQLACSPNPGGLPKIRIAEHHNRVGRDYQQETFDLACTIWECIAEEHIFKEMSLEESRSRCALLDEYHRNYQVSDGNSMDNFIKSCV